MRQWKYPQTDPVTEFLKQHVSYRCCLYRSILSNVEIKVPIKPCQAESKTLLAKPWAVCLEVGDAEMNVSLAIVPVRLL